MKFRSLTTALLVSLFCFAHSAFGEATSPGRPQAAIDSVNGVAGLWYDPELDGEGFNVITTPTGTVVFFFGYTADGARLWLVSENYPGTLEFGQQFELKMYEGNGGSFNEPAPPAVAMTLWGILTAVFEDCDSAQFGLDGVDGIKATHQVKLAGIMDANCEGQALPSPSGMAGLWYDPELDGEGFNIIITGSSYMLFYYGYDYAGTGRRLWLVSESFPELPKIGEKVNLKLFQASDGTFDSPAPPSEAFHAAGSIDITFTHCARAITKIKGNYFGEEKVSNLVKLAGIDQSTCPPINNGHNVMLRVVLVTEDWMPFASSAWSSAVPLKETENLKYYEAAIWEETQSVHLYAFPSDYDPWFEQRPGVTDEQKIAYREGYLVSKVTDLPADGAARRTALKNAFKSFATILVQKHPGSNHHLTYNGHGGPGGKLFQGELNYQDAAEFLLHWRQQLGRKLGVVDMGGPCDKGGFSDLENFCQHADYYIASDLPNGGYLQDEYSPERVQEVDPDAQYQVLFAEQPNLRAVLISRIDLKRQDYLYSQNFMTTNKFMQANYLYNCSQALQWMPGFKSFLNGKPKNYFDRQDLYQYMISNGASTSLQQGFFNVIDHQADNKDFFPWPENHNGLTMPSN
jgi:hypothetical protein